MTFVPIDLNTILLALFGMVGTIFAAWLTYIARKTHASVNSTATAAVAEIKRLNDLVATLMSYASRLEGLQGMPLQTARSIHDQSNAMRAVDNPDATTSQIRNPPAQQDPRGS